MKNMALFIWYCIGIAQACITLLVFVFCIVQHRNIFVTKFYWMTVLKDQGLITEISSNQVKSNHVQISDFRD